MAEAFRLEAADGLALVAGEARGRARRVARSGLARADRPARAERRSQRGAFRRGGAPVLRRRRPRRLRGPRVRVAIGGAAPVPHHGPRVSRPPGAGVPARSEHGAARRRDARLRRSERRVAVAATRSARRKGSARRRPRLRPPVHRVRDADGLGSVVRELLPAAVPARGGRAALLRRARWAHAAARAARRLPRSGDRGAARAGRRRERRALRLARRSRRDPRRLRERTRRVGGQRSARVSRRLGRLPARATPHGEAGPLRRRTRRTALVLDRQRRRLLVSQRAGARRCHADAARGGRDAARAGRSLPRLPTRLLVLSAREAAPLRRSGHHGAAHRPHHLGRAARHPARRHPRAAPRARRSAARNPLPALRERVAVLRDLRRLARRRSRPPEGRRALRTAAAPSGELGRRQLRTRLADRVLPRRARPARGAGPRARLAGRVGRGRRATRHDVAVVHGVAGRLLPDAHAAQRHLDPHQRRLQVRDRQRRALVVVPLRQRAGARARPAPVQGRVPLAPRRRRPARRRSALRSRSAALRALGRTRRHRRPRRPHRPRHC